MTHIKAWAIGVIGAAVLIGVIAYLKPNESFQKVMKIALSAFFIIAFLSPFLDKKILSDLSFQSNSAVAETGQGDFINEVLINSASERVKETVESVLKRRSLHFSNINVSMNIDKNNHIYINEISIEGVTHSQRQSVHDVLKKELRLDVKVK